MKRTIALSIVLLCLAATAQATMAVYAEITYPTVTTWRLWLTECDWSGTMPITPSGVGIASFAIDVSGVTSAAKATPSNVTLRNDDDPPTEIGSVGFPNGPGSALITDGVAQAFGGQDTTIPDAVFYGFGVLAGTYAAPAGWTTSSPYSWSAPGASGSDAPGVLVFGGKRNAGDTVSIVWGERAKANVFNIDTDIKTTTVDVVPEPSTMALLLLGAFALRRRA